MRLRRLPATLLAAATVAAIAGCGGAHHAEPRLTASLQRCLDGFNAAPDAARHQAAVAFREHRRAVAVGHDLHGHCTISLPPCRCEDPRDAQAVVLAADPRWRAQRIDPDDGFRAITMLSRELDAVRHRPNAAVVAADGRLEARPQRAPH